MDLESALSSLQLEGFLPKLRKLGVDNLAQVWVCVELVFLKGMQFVGKMGMISKNLEIIY